MTRNYQQRQGHGPVKIILSSGGMTKLQENLARSVNLMNCEAIDRLQKRGGFSQYMRVKR